MSMTLPTGEPAAGPWRASDSAPGMGRGRAEATPFWHEWMEQELAFLTQRKPWERACAVVCDAPPSTHEPGALLVAAPPYGPP